MSDADADVEQKARDVQELSLAIRPLLAGKPPEMQSAVLADLLSLWIAGHHPELREQMFRDHIALVRELVPESEKEMFGEAGHPGRGAPLASTSPLSNVQWFKLPMKLRRRWWRETDYGRLPASDALVAECLQQSGGNAP